MGVVKILLERKVPLSLSAAISCSARSLLINPPKIQVTPEVEKQVLEFILERARFVLRERQGFAYDEVNAAFAAGADELVDAEQRVAALKEIRHTKNFVPLAVAFKRIRKILAKAGAEGSWSLGAVDPNLFRETAERELHSISRKVAGRATSHKKAGRYREALEAIAEMRPVVDRFFDEVLVMDEDEQVRKNRLTLLAELLREFSTIADFSEMVSEETH